jgi:hypothetical protein
MRKRYFAVLLFASCLSAQANSGQSGAGTDESDARPPVTKADLQIAKPARRILNTKSAWNRQDTRNCPPEAKTFTSTVRSKMRPMS